MAAASEISKSIGNELRAPKACERGGRRRTGKSNLDLQEKSVVFLATQREATDANERREAFKYDLEERKSEMILDKGREGG